MDPYELQISLRPKSGGCGKPSREGPLADSELLGELCDLNRLVKVRVDVLLHVTYDDVVVRPPLDRSQVGQLTQAGVDEKGLGCFVGPLPPAEAVNQVEDQVEEGGRASRADDLPGIDDYLIRSDVDVRLTLLELRGESPMSGDGFVGEDPGLG